MIETRNKPQLVAAIETPPVRRGQTYTPAARNFGVSIPRRLVSNVSKHEGVGDAGKALLADQQVESHRGEIVGERLEDTRAFEIEDLRIAVASLAAFGPEIGRAGE